MEYSKIATTLLADSICRLAADAQRGFEFLRKIPSSRSKLFVDYWTENPSANAWSEYLRFLSSMELGVKGADVPMPTGWNEFVEQRATRWEYRPFTVRRTLGLLLVKTGKLPAHMRSPSVTDEQVRAYAGIEWPSEKRIIAAFARCFDIRLADSQGDSREYVVSSRPQAPAYTTKLVIVPQVCALSHYHEVEGLLQPFVLIDHALSWSPMNWDLITADNLDDAVDVLRKIVDDFEG